MKILITENQLDKVIDNFIAKEFGPLKLYGKINLSTQHRNPTHTFGGSLLNRNNEAVISLSWSKGKLIGLSVDKSIYDTIQRVFSLDKEQMKYYIIRFFKKIYPATDNITNVKSNGLWFRNVYTKDDEGNHHHETRNIPGMVNRFEDNYDELEND